MVHADKGASVLAFSDLRRILRFDPPLRRLLWAAEAQSVLPLEAYTTTLLKAYASPLILAPTVSGRSRRHHHRYLRMHLQPINAVG